MWPTLARTTGISTALKRAVDRWVPIFNHSLRVFLTRSRLLRRDRAIMSGGKVRTINHFVRSQYTYCVKDRRFMRAVGNLPSHQGQPACPLLNWGVDFCGLIWIHYYGGVASAIRLFSEWLATCPLMLYVMSSENSLDSTDSFRTFGGSATDLVGARRAVEDSKRMQCKANYLLFYLFILVVFRSLQPNLQTIYCNRKFTLISLWRENVRHGATLPPRHL